MGELNQRKVALLHRVVDTSDRFYRGHADVLDRSLINVAFNLANPDLEQRLLSEELTAGFSGLTGRRASAGFVRRSTTLTPSAVEELADFMDDFQKR